MGPFGWAPAPSPTVAPGRDKEGRERLATAGPGPLAVGLATGASEEAKELASGSRTGSASGCWGHQWPAVEGD
jgi:hypothetical protein